MRNTKTKDNKNGKPLYIVPVLLLILLVSGDFALFIAQQYPWDNIMLFFTLVLFVLLLILNALYSTNTKKIKNIRKIYVWVLHQDFQLAQELASGGEGRIFTIENRPNDVAKIFHQPSAEKVTKLKSMLAHPPHDPTRESHLKHISIAWPRVPIQPDPERIPNNPSIWIGFTMPYIRREDTFPLLKLYNPHDRKGTGLGFTWEYLLRIALNLASIVNELHRKGYVIGDLNESNILVTKKALVTLVDCDSIQVPRKKRGWQQLAFWQKNYFRCTVGKPEFTPPELQGRDFSQVNRTANHDNFSLAVLIFLLLMEGWHPFAAVWQGKGTAPSLEQNIKLGIFPYQGKWNHLHPKYAPPLDILPPQLQDLMEECFVRGRKPFLWFLQRPGANRWLDALKDATHHLAYCNKNKSHVYSDHLDHCPWCKRIDILGISDPFPPQLRRQQQQLQQPQATKQTQPTAGQRISRVGRRRIRRAFSNLFTLLLFYVIAAFFLFLTPSLSAFRIWFMHLIRPEQIAVGFILFLIPSIIFIIPVILTDDPR